MVEKVWNDPEIFRIQVGLPNNPLRNLNSYVIRTPERTLIIDTGFRREECRADLLAGLEELKVDWAKAALFITHFHSDHSGLVWEFVDRGVPVYMGAVEHQYYCRYVAGDLGVAMDRMVMAEGFPQEQMDLQPTANQSNSLSAKFGFPVIGVQDGERLPMGDLEVKALCTPGHTPGNMVLYLPQQQVLFSGDHILFDITPNISCWPEVEDPLACFIESLQDIWLMPIKACFPAHREAGEDTRSRIDKLIEHHHRRLDEIWQAVTAAPGSTAYEVAGRITWSARGLGWEQFPPHQRWFAMTETIAHLHYLANKGQLVRKEQDGIVHYYLGDERLLDPV